MPVPRTPEPAAHRTARAAPALLPVIVLLLSMAACAALPPAPPPMAGGRCNADAARWAIGRAPDGDVVERTRVDAGSATVRVIRPGDPVDMDRRTDRLNLNVNARGAIDALKCG